MDGTSDLCLRRAALYPAELRVLSGGFTTFGDDYQIENCASLIQLLQKQLVNH